MTCPHLRTGNPRISRGVSVLEVLISIGVASIGLLGVILLVPLADHQMNRGFMLERASQTGVNAVRDFEARGMHDPTTWMWGARGVAERL
ncbi:MAG: hypothetical protein KY475_13580, partial [Planctomycetes bacterium]|nr:hypothetical protein [Planctomycetota bacterium]